MKILAVRGRNLASLEGDFEIDFTSEPLKSAGIFAITGNTGSGKSTVLDAICLALFNATPRTRQAKREKEKNETNLSGTDTRNILRKGTGEGYAEVDFVALNGERFRSTWRVQRAGKNPAGNFQSKTQQLVNLTASKEENLSKKEYPLRINELIGLTFDQFTRSVLLAQGDFAAFLKAGDDEKAELLEKLTGTDIYSKISIEIHNKTKKAKEEYDLLQLQIAHITLLTEEEMNELNNQKNILTKKIEQIKSAGDKLDKNRIWFEQKEKILRAIQQSEKEQNQITEKIESASDRYEYFNFIEASSEIRNDYLELKNIKNRLIEQQKQLLSSTLLLKKNEEKRILFEEKLNQTEEKRIEINNQLEKLKPVIEKINALEIQIETENRTKENAEAEYNREKEKRKETEKRISRLEKQHKEETESLQSLSEWFRLNKPFENIIPQADLIIGYLNQAKRFRENKQIVEREIAMIQNQKNKLQHDLTAKENEENKLNETLPLEIIQLRKQLKSGEACPICGSVEHPFEKEIYSEDFLFNEESLKKQKTQIAEAVIQLKKEINRKEKEEIEKQTFKVHYEDQYSVNISAAEAYLSFLPSWKEQFADSSLQNELKMLSEKWTLNTQLSNTKNNLLDSVSIHLENEKKLSESICIECEHNKAIFEKHVNRLEELKNNLLQLSGGQNIKALEAELKKEKDCLSALFEKEKKEKEETINEQSKQQGAIDQMKQNIQLSERKIKESEAKVSDWLNKPDQKITLELLDDLVSKSYEWIQSERDFLNQMKNNQIKISATLKEREQQLKEHELSENKPENDLQKENLILLKQENQKIESNLQNELTRIQVHLTKNQQDKDYVSKIEKEMKQKEESLDTWQKLNHLLGSHDGSLFKRMAQAYTLDILLGYANRHLELLSKRYCLKKDLNSLALSVIDKDMLDDVRTVHSLSGGESFLISLALALGLSSLSSNRMNIESLFIDEGFGSLDADTLSVAMDALENLQTQGKKIGVISHVQEMTERISVQIQLIGTGNGKSYVKIKS
ncbi:MAG: AAA family ATPase [Dysgonamonadaceae bacterium]|jgi:exonuclease SbcC|nr:AAA family ATPase [Dysgonamonadaceae bacterium]